MIILAIADRPPRTSIKSILQNNHVDLICTLGDLDFFMLKELQDINDMPKIGVYGNHCSGKYFESLGIKNMHLQTFEFQGVIFGGFEGSVRYKESSYAKMYTQKEAQVLLRDFPYVDVMLTHAPPYGINDEPNDPTHAGLIGIRDYVLSKKPKYLMHGHTYPNSKNMVTKLGETGIIYVYQDKLIDLPL